MTDNVLSWLKYLFERNANPPTLLLTLHKIVGELEEGMNDWWREYLR